MYSQNNEELLIIDHFGASFKGTLLDIGANDGVTLSNSRAALLRGWSGVLVDPSPSAFAKLSGLYASSDTVECHNVGICEDNGAAVLHESGTHLGKGDVALLSSIKKEETSKWKSTGARFTPTEMECVTFAELMKRSKYHQFDLISIDAEGMDYEILSQIDLRTIGCSMLIVENNGKEEHRFVQYCREYGMRLKTKNPENLLFVR